MYNVLKSPNFHCNELEECSCWPAKLKEHSKDVFCRNFNRNKKFNFIHCDHGHTGFFISVKQRMFVCFNFESFLIKFAHCATHSVFIGPENFYFLTLICELIDLMISQLKNHLYKFLASYQPNANLTFTFLITILKPATLLNPSL